MAHRSGCHSNSVAASLLLLLSVTGSALSTSYKPQLLDSSSCYPQCENGGSCYTSSQYVGVGICKCTPEYTGTLCRDFVGNPATQAPVVTRLSPKLGNSRCRYNGDCYNGGTCSDGFCQCTRFFSGVNCRLQQESPHPYGQACAHTCVNGECDSARGKCACRPAFTGADCSVPSGTCEYTFPDWDYVCTCTQGYSGQHCHERAHVTCPRLSTVLGHGTVVVSADQSSGTVRYGTTARYTCKAGYVLRGNSTRHCRADGTWGGNAPVCVPMPTQPPRIPCRQGCGYGACDATTGTCRCSHGYYGEFCGTKSGTCRYSTAPNWQYVCDCVDGFTGQYCQQLVTCPALSTSLAYGMITVSEDQSGGTVSFGTTARHTCNSGYVLEGNAVRACSSGANWDGIVPRCVTMPTTQPPRVECPRSCGYGTCDFNTGMCMCRHGYYGQYCTTQSGHCSYRPPNWQYSCLCSDGYKGEHCQELVTCPRISTSLRYGLVTVSSAQSIGSVAYATTATYACNAGYVLSGDMTRSCQKDGAWSGVAPRCVPPPTQPPTPPCNPVCQHGTCDYISKTCRCHHGFFGSDCSIRSGHCYKASNGKGYTCVCSEGFQGKHCEQRIRCPSIPATLNYGIVVFSNRPVNGYFPYGATAKYTCNSGYRLSGNAGRHCSRNGSWNGTVPACHPIPPPPPKTSICPALAPPANGRVQQQTYKITTLMVFSCNPGFRLSGSVARICLPNGQWSGTTTACTPIVCPAPPSIAYGTFTGSQYTFGGVVSYSCQPGYNLVGNQELRCLADGRWSGSAPRCQRASVQQCCLLDAVAYTALTSGQGQRHIGARVMYSCLPGYALRSGNALRVCQSNGAWSGTPPRCERAVCPDPGMVQNAQRAVSNPLFSAASTVTYTCNAGYTLAGTGQLSCTNAGTWSAAPPRCEMRATCDGRFGTNQTVYLSPQRNQPLAADVVVVVEETLELVQEYGWLRQIISDIEANLTGLGIGSNPALRNHYTLVGYGRSVASGKSCQDRLISADNAATTFTAEHFMSAASQLVPDWGFSTSRDAYSAIAFGLKSATLRYGPNIAHNLILMTSNDRGILCQPAVSRASLKRQLQENGFLVNFVVDHPLMAGFDKEEDVFAVRLNPEANTLSAVLRSKKTNLRKVSDAFINFTLSSAGNTNQDYTQLALGIGGVVWNINMLDTGSINVQTSFSFAFRTVKASEMYLQAKSCKMCTCLASGNLRCRLVSDQEACLDRCVLQQPPIVPAVDCGHLPSGPATCVGDSICNF